MPCIAALTAAALTILVSTAEGTIAPRRKALPRQKPSSEPVRVKACARNAIGSHLDGNRWMRLSVQPEGNFS